MQLFRFYMLLTFSILVPYVLKSVTSSIFIFFAEVYIWAKFYYAFPISKQGDYGTVNQK